MKKFIIFILLLAMCMPALTSCSGESTTDIDTETSSEKEPDSISGEEISDSILKINCVEYDETAEQISDAVVLDERYLVVAWYGADSGKAGIRYYDLYTSELMKEYYFENNGTYDLTSYGGNSFAAYCYGSEYIYFDDVDDDEPEIISLKNTESENVEGSEYVYDDYYFYAPKKYVHTVNEKIYLGGYGEEEALLCDLSEYYEDYLSFKYEAGGKFFFSSTNKFTLEADLFAVNSDGSFKYLEEYEYGTIRTSEDKVYISDYTSGKARISLKSNLYYDLTIFFDNDEEDIVFVSDDRFATMKYTYSGNEETATLMVYSTEDASLIYQTDEFSGMWVSAGEFISDDQAFVMLNGRDSTEKQNNEYAFYIIDLTDAEPLARKREMGTDLSIPMELEAKLERDYGVEIYTGVDAIIDFPDFYATELNNAATITETLRALQWVMERFPEGFFEELYSDEIEYGPRQLEIHITSKLTPAGNTGTSFPAAYAYYDYGNNVQKIVVDGTQSYTLRTNFAHEIMHAIETRINNKTDYEIYFGFERWYDYLPEGFEYNFSYRGDDGGDYNNYDYTPTYNADAENVYFIDAYSKTFALEDRARLFESLFMSETELNSVFAYEHIRDRAEYLCEVIRENFESVRNADSVWWERFLK